MKTYKQAPKGFTLIELIVTLAILGLILAISVPSYMEVKNKSEFRADLVTISLVENADDHYLSINASHSFDESIEQSVSNFQDSLDNLAGSIFPVTFNVITNIHWAKEDTHWYIAYDTTSSGGDENTDEYEELPDYPEWDPNQDHYNSGEHVLYQGRVFKAIHWTRTEPGFLGNPWNEITDEWRNFNLYKQGDLVEYNGAQFKAREYTNPGASAPGTSSGNWQELTNEWRSFNIYKGGDIVIYNNSTYRAKFWHKNKTPGTDSVWMLLD